MAGLNPQQKKAAHHRQGPALVIAGPGTGKTRTLVARYTHLIEREIAPQSIFTVTFTRKSSQEFKDRIQEQTGLNPSNLPIGTFNSLARFKCNTEDEFSGRQLLEGSAHRFALWSALGLQGEERKKAQHQIQQWKNLGRTVKEVLSTVQQPHNADALYYGKIYSDYQDYLAHHMLYDFTDQIGYTVEALKASSQLRSRLQDKYRYILVDEYQDINQLQFQLLELLCGSEQNLWVVGDLDQSIYSFRGSSVSYIANFSRHFSEATIYNLGQTYRYGKNILALSRNLIERNDSALRQDLVSKCDYHGQALIVRTDEETNEAIWITALIEELLAKGLRPSDIAILARCHYVLRPISAMLLQKKIPHVHQEDGKAAAFWNEYIIQVLVYVLARDAGEKPQALKSKAGYHIRKLQETLDELNLKSFPDKVVALAQAAKEIAPTSQDHEQALTWSANCLRFEIESVSHSSYQSLSRYIQEQRQPKRSNKPETRDKVLLTSIHQAKGLEWDTVIVAGCEEDTLPHQRSTSEEQKAEERRLAYVASTRSIHSVVFTYAQRRGDKSQKRSTFLDEIINGNHHTSLEEISFPPPSVPRKDATHNPASKPRERKPYTQVTEVKLEKGQRVVHSKFGVGTIVKVVDDKKREVLFRRGGRKVILADYLEPQ